ncbi:hypothetical protein HED60_15725 [Planctomycetales bacterium ZRK34]|nr:hypothetical protein HED60_15725 [Planctomycetales bacterium ZRK34]
MFRNILFMTLVSIYCVGCTTVDPLTAYLNHHGFKPIFPPTSKATVGDLYESSTLSGQPVELVENLLSSDERNSLMASVSRDVTLMNSSRESKYKIDSDIFALGYIRIELENEGATSFRVSAGNAREYLMSSGYFNRALLPRLKQRSVQVVGAYIYKLLEVDTLEYEFYREDGTKIDVKPGDRISQVFQDRVGAQWSVNERNNIEITSPRFIGFQAKSVGSNSSGLTTSYQTNRHSQQVAALVAGVEGMSNLSAEDVIIDRIPQIDGKLSGKEFIAILDSPPLTSLSREDVIEACAKYIRYPLTPAEIKGVLRGMGTLSQEDALKALHRADH